MNLALCPNCKDAIYVIRNPFNRSFKFHCRLCQVNFNSQYTKGDTANDTD